MLALAACGKVSDAPDAPVAIDASPDATPITSCTPNEFVDCAGTVARTCNSSGTGSVDAECGAPGCNATAKRCNQCTPGALTCGNKAVDHCGADGLPGVSDSCSLSCAAAPTPHCAYIQPNYQALANACDLVATTGMLEVAADQTIDTSQVGSCTGGVITQTGGPDICVLRYGTIKIDAGKTLTASGPRAIALVADTALTIEGTLDVSASGSTNGPGGGTATSGGAPAADTGGGGAGFQTAGGAGAGSLGGPAGTNPADLIALVGGPRATAGAVVGAGGGGGAATLVACRGALTVAATGIIDAGGGGGPGGIDPVNDDSGSVHYSGGGGGAGGNVVLQGVSITVLGQVFANGGGGGGGTAVDQNGTPGGDGTRSATVAAAGGAPTCATSGGGGAGGRAGATPGIGSTQATFPQSCSSGGGGGSVGFLQTYTPTGVTPTLTPSAASPAFQTNRTVQTR